MPIVSQGLATRFDQQMYPAGQKGGMQFYPLSGVLSGLKVTAGTITATACPINISAGAARLDGTMHELAAAITNLAMITGTGFDLAPVQTFEVYLNPRRRVPALTTAPGGPDTGDRYLKVQNVNYYQVVEQGEVYNGAAWEKFDLVRSKPGYGHNNMILNDINPVIHTATSNNLSFSTAPEKIVYLPTSYPPYVQGPSMAYLRRPASILLATIQLSSGAATIVPYGDRSLVTV
jgi:hypothetical protein